jgi:deazaflavin-dependent oxidoreductase (nitroreductase family)
MPLSKRVAHFNKHVTNRLTRHVAGWLPGFGIVSHVGRRSGRSYQTPVNVFRVADRYLFALTYGRNSDWVQNVVSAGRCEITTRRKRVELVNPTLLTDATRHHVPLPARWILGIIDVEDFLTLEPIRHRKA